MPQDFEDGPPVCPECRTGKHGNCDGWAFDEKADQIVQCQCQDDSHA